MAFWRVTRLETSRSATSQPLPTPITMPDRIRAAVITSMREKPRWPFRRVLGRLLQHIALADAVHPAIGHRAGAGGAVTPVRRRRIAIHHNLAFASLLGGAGSLHPAGRDRLGGRHGAGGAGGPAYRGGAGGAQDGPDLELDGGVAGLGGGDEIGANGGGAERRVAANHDEAEIAGIVETDIQARGEVRLSEVAGGAAVKPVAYLVAALLGGDVQKVGRGLAQMGLL